MKQIILKILTLFLTLNIYAQSDKIVFNSGLDKIKFHKSGPSKVKKALKTNFKISDVAKGWSTRSDGCFRFTEETLKYEKEGLTFTFRKVRKPFFVPLFLKRKTLRRITVSDSSNVILNQTIIFNKSSLEEVKKIYGEPANLLDENGGITLEYGNIYFYFNKERILKGALLFSLTIERKKALGL